MRYSPSTRGFYPQGIAYANLPPDLIDIADEYHAELLAAQATGQEIVPGVDGVPVAAAPPVPDQNAVRATMSLSLAQLLIGLEAEGWLTTAEAEDWLDGILPGAVLALIATLPANEQFAAKARAKRPAAVERTNALVVLLGQQAGKSEEELDAFFLRHASV